MASPVLTKLSFRRDVRLFLTLLAGFLVVLILALVIVLETFVSRMELVQRRAWNATADVIAGRLSVVDRATLQRQLEELRKEHGLAAIAVRDLRSGFPASTSVSAQRPIAGGNLTLWFDASELARSRRLARTTITISTAAAGLGLVLLFLYLPQVVGPVERMLDEAKVLGEKTEGLDDGSYLVDTFRKTIETMRHQAAELERLHERERLRANELELLTGTLTRSLTSGFIALDAAGVVVDLNRAARDILGAAQAEPGRPIQQTLPPSPFTELVADACARRQTLSRGEIEQGDMVIGFSTVPLINDQHQFLGLMVLFTDVTPIRRLETLVREQQALADLGEMSAGIAHEFRNALSTILGYLSLTRRQDLPADVTARLAAVEQETRLLSSVVDSLLRFAHPLTLESEPVELHALLEQLVNRFREQHPSVEFALQGQLRAIQGDSIALRSCFENLLRNSVEAVSTRGGRVEVTLSGDGTDDAVVTVRDDGAGLDPADIPRLFRPFQSGRAGGTGLGLSLARKIAILHGGSLTMTGGLGEGARVTVTLPAHRALTDTKSTNSDDMERPPRSAGSA